MLSLLKHPSQKKDTMERFGAGFLLNDKLSVYLMFISCKFYMMLVIPAGNLNIVLALGIEKYRI